MDNLRKVFDSFGVTLSPAKLKEFDRYLMSWELRDDHPLTLNSASFGVHKIIFTTDDRIAFFNIFDLDEKEMTKVIRQLRSINTDHKVASDTFNLFIIYLVHRCIRERIHKNYAIKFLALLHYKFFTSLINQRFFHGADPEIVEAVVEKMNMKYDLKVHETWKKMIIDKCERILKGIHTKTLQNYGADKEVFYVLSDSQTRIRKQVRLVTDNYYYHKENRDIIATANSTMTVDGEKVLRESSSGYGNISGSVYSKMLNRSAFISEEHIARVLVIQKDISKGILMNVLIMFTEIANEQRAKGNSEKVIVRRDGTRDIVGIKALLDTVISSVYRSALNDNNVNTNNMLDIFMMTRRLYTSSRTKNEDVIGAKAAVKTFIVKNKISKRVNTINSLAVAIPLYLTLMSFESLTK